MAPALAEDPVVTACKEKVKRFRIQELKDVLQKLGISKQGKKQELVDKITAVLSDQQYQDSKVHGSAKKQIAGKETIVEIVEDTFRKMREPACTILACKNETESGHSVNSKEGPDDSVKVCCPCGNSMPTVSMIKCDNPQCNVWQHVGCVIISEKYAENGPPELPSSFYCEICRINRADPFWVTINYPLLPMSIFPTERAADGTYAVQSIAKCFLLTRVNREMLQRAEYDIQVWCILFDDKVPFRMHWPLHSDMLVNDQRIRVVNRPASQQLGTNGRDDGPLLTQYLKEGNNKIVLTKSDARTFCLGVRIAKRRSLEEVLNLVPKEQDGEKFDDAVARVRRCVGGGTKADNADSDSDIEVVADLVSVNLRCPMTGSRVKIAARFKPCVHMGCFDLEAFVKLNERSRKWQCPICLKNYSLEHIIIDPYFNRITSLIQNCGDDVSDIDIKPDGSWRVKGGAVLKDLTQWHLPDGTLHVVTDIGSNPKIDIVKQEVKEQFPEESSCHLKLGIRKYNNGGWEIRKKRGANSMLSSNNDRAGHLTNGNCITPTSNNDHTNAKDGSYNLEPAEFDHPANNVYDLESSPVVEHVLEEPVDQDIIVLSDSDDDNAMVLSPTAVNCGSAHDIKSQFAPTNPPKTSGICAEQSGGGPAETLFLNESCDDLGLPLLHYTLSTQNDLGTQGTDNLGQAQINPANHLYSHKADSGVNLGLVAPAANPPESGHASVLQASVSLTCTDVISAENASREKMKPGQEITTLDGSAPRSTNGDDLTRERCDSSLARRQALSSTKYVQNIDSESE